MVTAGREVAPPLVHLLIELDQEGRYGLGYSYLRVGGPHRCAIDLGHARVADCDLDRGGKTLAIGCRRYHGMLPSLLHGPAHDCLLALEVDSAVLAHSH